MISETLKLDNIFMSFASGETVINVLNNVNITVRKGESVALVGESGTGKSTLLQIAALLEKPSTGSIFVNEVLTNSLTDNEKTKIRRENIGFVYQFHNLLPEFSSVENVMIPQLINRISKNKAKDRAIDLLNSVGLSKRLNHPSKKLSGGERQRVAIARALANNPDIIIADEPTGNLDPMTASVIFNLFLNLTKQEGISVLMATHNLDLAKRLDSIIQIR
jgi:lipoprotein-releasing system ATP-binding protein